MQSRRNIWYKIWNPESRFGILLISPALLILAFIVLYPFLSSLRLAFFSKNLLRPAKGVPFVGLKNFRYLFTKSDTFLTSFQNSFVLTIGTVVSSLVIGLILALILNKSFRGRALVRTIFILPWAVPTVVAAMIWVWLLNYQFGSVNSILTGLHIIPERIAWFSEKRSAMTMVIVAHVWKQVPFVLLVLLAGLQTIPNEIRDAAKVDGASALGEFWHITLPGLSKFIALIFILRTIWTFNWFGYAYLLTGGGPGIATRTLPIDVYTTAFREFRFGRASAIAFVMSVILAIFIILFMRLHKRMED